MVMSFFAIFQMIVNGIQDNDKTSGSFKHYSDIGAILTLGSHGKAPEESDTGSSMDLIVTSHSILILVLMLLFFCFNIFQMYQMKVLDESQITPSDFTVLVNNIPIDKSEEEVKEYVTQKLGYDDVKEVIFCYNISRVIKLIRSMKKAQQV